LHSLPQSPFSPPQIFNFRFASRSPLKNFYAFSPAKPHVSPYLKFIFDFSFDSSPHLTYRHLVNSTPRPDLVAILTAVADSIATAREVSVKVSDVEACVKYLQSRPSFTDVDWDTFPNRVTIFGDDSSVWTDPDGDGDEGRFVLNLMRSVSLTANPFNE
jgi:hypothetical protein